VPAGGLREKGKGENFRPSAGEKERRRFLIQLLDEKKKKGKREGSCLACPGKGKGKKSA